jgi:hypothetical protein
LDFFWQPPAGDQVGDRVGDRMGRVDVVRGPGKPAGEDELAEADGVVLDPADLPAGPLPVPPAEPAGAAGGATIGGR